MKILLILLILISSTAFATGGTYFNPDRDGEGVSVFIRGDTLAFQFYTYYDRSLTVEPVPSPAPPPSSEIVCANEAVWYIGISSNWNEEGATGDLYLSHAIDYPHVTQRRDGTDGLNESVKVGTFSMIPDDEGFDLLVEPTGVLPRDMYLFNNRFSFHKLIIK